MPTPKLSEAKRKAVLSLATGNLSYREIRDRTGVSAGKIAEIVKEAGIESKGRKTIRTKREAVVKEMKKGGTYKEISRRAGVCDTFVLDVFNSPQKSESPTIELPAGIAKQYTQFTIDTSGIWGIISDIHIPCHDDTTLRLFVAECKRRAVKGVILNGDVLDSHEVSDHDKDPSMPRYAHELELGKRFLQWLRQELPNARIIYKHGNHEERAARYIFRRAPALEGLAGINIRSWLEMESVGVEDLPGKRVIGLGKLHVVHGHEYRGGGGVNPARWLFLRARSVAICGHFHRTSEHHERNIALKFEAAWSLGCACDLHPDYAPLNNWNHGFGFCELSNDGNFAFENKRVFGGKVV